MSVCLIILFETAINTYEYVYSKSLNMCLFKFSDFQRQKKKKNGEPIEIMFFFLSHFDVTCIFTSTFSGISGFPTIKTNHHDITKILLKVVT